MLVKDTLTDIRKKLQEGFYKNEEHVRLSLVARVLQQLGWDIWNPAQVFTEFPVVPSEDLSRVDIALFSNPYEPSVFIEVKAVGKLDRNIFAVERQLRDYNRNNTAPFSIITDGRKWRFYYSQTGGEFAQKCFKVVDILKDDIDDLQVSFLAFMSKSKIISGDAGRDAQSFLRLSRKQRVMENSLPKARRMVMIPPYPSLPDALAQLVSQDGYSVTIEETLEFIQKIDNQPVVSATPQVQPPKATPVSVIHKKKKSLLPPNGTICRFSYKNKIFRGKVQNAELVVGELGRFSSFSAASVAATNTSRNGWRDWEIQLPGISTWQLADAWRKQR